MSPPHKPPLEPRFDLAPPQGRQWSSKALSSLVLGLATWLAPLFLQLWFLLVRPPIYQVMTPGLVIVFSQITCLYAVSHGAGALKETRPVDGRKGYKAALVGLILGTTMLIHILAFIAILLVAACRSCSGM